MTRRLVSAIVYDVVAVSGVKLDLREDRPRRLRRLTLVVKSLELRSTISHDAGQLHI